MFFRNHHIANVVPEVRQVNGSDRSYAANGHRQVEYSPWQSLILEKKNASRSSFFTH